MARKRTKIGVGPELMADLKQRLRAATDLRDKERLQVALWATGGQHTLAELAQLAGRARSTIQIWPNRDPIEEVGFGSVVRKQYALGDRINSYGFVLNDAINQVDPLGLFNFNNSKDWLLLKKLLDQINEYRNLYSEGKCPKNPCLSVTSLLSVPCNCLVSASGNLNAIADCICLGSPDPDCGKTFKNKAPKIIGLH